MSISDVLRSVTGKRDTCLLQHEAMLVCGNTVGRKNWDKTKQNVAARIVSSCAQRGIT